MADLFKYVCLECDIATFVHWYATEKSQHPYCASCGSDQFMKLVAEVDIYDEEKVTCQPGQIQAGDMTIA